MLGAASRGVPVVSLLTRARLRRERANHPVDHVALLAAIAVDVNRELFRVGAEDPALRVRGKISGIAQGHDPGRRPLQPGIAAFGELLEFCGPLLLREPRCLLLLQDRLDFALQSANGRCVSADADYGAATSTPVRSDRIGIALGFDRF